MTFADINLDLQSFENGKALNKNSVIDFNLIGASCSYDPPVPHISSESDVIIFINSISGLLDVNRDVVRLCFFLQETFFAPLSEMGINHNANEYKKMYQTFLECKSEHVSTHRSCVEKSISGFETTLFDFFEKEQNSADTHVLKMLATFPLIDETHSVMNYQYFGYPRETVATSLSTFESKVSASASFAFDGRLDLFPKSYLSVLINSVYLTVLNANLSDGVFEAVSSSRLSRMAHILLKTDVFERTFAFLHPDMPYLDFEKKVKKARKVVEGAYERMTVRAQDLVLKLDRKCDYRPSKETWSGFFFGWQADNRLCKVKKNEEELAVSVADEKKIITHLLNLVYMVSVGRIFEDRFELDADVFLFKEPKEEGGKRHRF
eukprot:GDKJ01046763.1.p1 GENE.GDKJ01046763.1~~GDKJ01046763.1.p1  ORF type:complete len:389 (+),score=80.91 GDKJ01046763.1:35-1168(+)